jgi:hypothetical protein
MKIRNPRAWQNWKKKLPIKTQWAITRQRRKRRNRRQKA